MALTIRIGVSFTNTAIPILRNDAIANAGTLDIFDARETGISWPSQAAPVVGVDTWASLVGSNTASFSGSPGFTDGFTTDTTDQDIINLPSTFQFSGTDDRCIIFWFKAGTTADNLARIGGWGKTGTGDSPYLFYKQGAEIIVTSGLYDIQFLDSFPFDVGVLQQLAISFERGASVYSIKLFKNGVNVGTFAANANTMTLGGESARFAGDTFSNPTKIVGTYLRAVADDLSVTTPEALVALDYATHYARLNA